MERTFDDIIDGYGSTRNISGEFDAGASQSARSYVPRNADDTCSLLAASHVAHQT